MCRSRDKVLREDEDIYIIWSSLFSFQCSDFSSSQPTLCNNILLPPCSMMYYFFSLFFWCPCMAINPSGPTRVFTDHFTDHFFLNFFVGFSSILYC